MRRRLVAVLTLLTLAALLLVLTTPWSQRRANDDTGAALTDLRAVEELRARFNEDAGMARLILLLSPT